tara:strand:- start:1721 stop:1963 length:243 start_codon:yes stop_codon:yes gene_type:complete
MDEFKKDIRDIRESQIRMEGDLKYHIRRTDALEARIDHHNEVLQPLYAWTWFKKNYKHILFIFSFIAGMVYLMVKSKLGA